MFYSCNVKSKRYDPEKRISSFWGNNKDEDSKEKEPEESSEDEPWPKKY